MTLNESIVIRPEAPADFAAIGALIEAAFRHVAYSQHNEQHMVTALRAAQALALSLVAEYQGEVVGHVAASAVMIDGETCGWYGLAPLAVLPAWQGRGIGALLVEATLAQLRQQGAAGCVLLGEPAYYQRFGFRALEALVLPGAPAEYFLALPFMDEVPRGCVQYHAAFGS